MSFNVTKEGEYFIVSASPIVYENLDNGREIVSASFQANSATFGKPEWTGDKFPCEEREGYWNRLRFRQLGQYHDRKIGIFGSTAGLKETFCGPREAGEVIMNEAAIRQRVYGRGNPYYIGGRKAVKDDKGSIAIAFLLPHQVSQRVKLEELFERGVIHTEEIRTLLAA